ncbi:4-hydroxyphenylpyruvate dioxygenase [Nocardiopsis sp. CNR-923]|uniref:4-hydroxyphenylpyruvate dioxygenase n=1 Tax=Nocardiopsis sp. CNR-923 TaxID=1904965 RepID=UPI00095DC186|nr:4-hydroxyphenylpyruvate dioxygenase [Nocardiopsis sp. CNR-923]OLT24613.1 4-hydroxyphenylpyruvate dioxygenase [Nocardiopsis sp. CNR-923]
MTDQPLPESSVDHVVFHVGDAHAAATAVRDGYGLDVYAMSRTDREVSVAVGAGGIRLVFTEARTDDHPAAAFVREHGDGVADIALRTPDARAAHTAVVSRGATSVSPPAEHQGIVTATVGGFGDVVHTFVERAPGIDVRSLPGLTPAGGTQERASGTGLHEVDHFAVCLEGGRLDPTVRFYRDVFGFATIFTEYIVVGDQAMDSTVVQSPSGRITLTLIEPDLSREPGQIDAFLKNHVGPGVQHIAFTTDDIVRTVGLLRERGTEFLATPDAYYRTLSRSVKPSKHSMEALRRLHLLVDEDHDGQLFQIFARSTHPQRTFFFEVIERLGATTFGSGNIKALYEAVEEERSR